MSINAVCILVWNFQTESQWCSVWKVQIYTHPLTTHSQVKLEGWEDSNLEKGKTQICDCNFLPVSVSNLFILDFFPLFHCNLESRSFLKIDVMTEFKGHLSAAFSRSPYIDESYRPITPHQCWYWSSQSPCCSVQTQRRQMYKTSAHLIYFTHFGNIVMLKISACSFYLCLFYLHTNCWRLHAYVAAIKGSCLGSRCVQASLSLICDVRLITLLQHV